MIYQPNYNRFDNKPSILWILAEYGIEVKQQGQRYWASCPFHFEKTPSMCIYPEQSKFYCFSCQRSGDSYDVLAFLSGKPLREVLRDYRIELPSPEILQKQRERAEILRRFEAECIACWKKLVELLRKTYDSEQQLQAPTDDNLERLADIYFLREIVEQLLSKLEDSDIKVRLNAINEARTRGLC